MAKKTETVLKSLDVAKILLAVAINRLGGSILITQEDLDEVAMTCVDEHQGTLNDGRPFVQFVMQRRTHPTKQ